MFTMENEDEKWERGSENQIHDNSSEYHLKGEAVLKISPPKEILESFKSKIWVDRISNRLRISGILLPSCFPQ